MAYESAYALLLNMSFFAAPSNLYTTLMGAWWIFILYIGTLITLYVVSKSEAALVVFGLIGSGWLLYKLALIPVGMQVILYILLALSIAMLLYKVFGGGND